HGPRRAQARLRDRFYVLSGLAWTDPSGTANGGILRLMRCGRTYRLHAPPGAAPAIQPARSRQRPVGVTGSSGSARLAEEQVCRQHVERLEAALDVMEDTLQVRKHAGGELVHQKGASRGQRAEGLEQNALAQLGRDGAEGNAGDDVVDVLVPLLAQDLVHRFG